MSAENKKPGPGPLNTNTRLRNFLWGVHRNKQKMLTLVDLNLNHLQKSLELKQEEKGRLSAQPANDTQNLERLMQNSKEIGYLEREIKKTEAVRGVLTAGDNPWPRSRVREPEIPQAKPVKTAPPAPSSPEKTPSRKILIIEDESIIIKSISYFLLQENFKVIFSLNAEDGLKKTLKEMPDLILLDIMMPGMNGYQFLAKLKSTKPVAHIPVIILSSLSRESDILEGLERGAADYITKPFSPKVLLSKIKKIITAQNGNPPYLRND